MGGGAHPRRRMVLLGVGLAAGVWALAAAWLLWSARADLRAGAEGMRSVRGDASVSGLLDEEVERDLEAASASFASASRSLGHPVLAPLRVAPFAGNQLGAASELADAGERGTQVAIRAVADLRPLAESSQAGGPERLALLGELATIAERSSAELAPLEVGARSGLVGPLADAVAEVEEQRDAAVEAADNLGRASRALAAILAGPEPYLLLGANNAEMRHGAGMYLSATELTFVDGALELGEVQPTAELVLPAGSVPVAGDLAENWPWLDHGRDLRTLGFTASFPESAEIAVRTWEATPEGGPTAGVIAIDVDGVRGLLRAVGPVEVDGIRYTADNVRGELLREQYLRFSDDRDERRDQLGDVARAVLERVEAGEYELADLATELADAVAGRHLLIWSADADHQAVWDQVRIGGRLGERSVAVGLVNRAGNKLDSWIDTSVAIDTSDGRIEVELEVRNGGPRQGPPYVVGPNIEGLEAGGHRAIVVVNLPAGTTEVELDGARQVLLGGDGATVVVAGELDVAADAAVTVTVRGRLASSVESVVVEPTARVPRTRWEVDGRTFERDRRRTVTVAEGN